MTNRQWTRRIAIGVAATILWLGWNIHAENRAVSSFEQQACHRSPCPRP